MLPVWARRKFRSRQKQRLAKAVKRIIGTLRSTMTRQGGRRGLQNVKKQCQFKLLKEVTVN